VKAYRAAAWLPLHPGWHYLSRGDGREHGEAARLAVGLRGKERGVLGYLDEEGAQVKAALKKRWTQRISIALHRTTMEAVWYRALDIQDAASRRSGGPMSLTAIDLRFGGGLGLGNGG